MDETMYFPSATLNASRARDSTHTEKNLLPGREQILICKSAISDIGDYPRLLSVQDVTDSH